MGHLTEGVGEVSSAEVDGPVYSYRTRRIRLYAFWLVSYFTGSKKGQRKCWVGGNSGDCLNFSRLGKKTEIVHLTYFKPIKKSTWSFGAENCSSQDSAASSQTIFDKKSKEKSRSNSAFKPSTSVKRLSRNLNRSRKLRQRRRREKSERMTNDSKMRAGFLSSR